MALDDRDERLGDHLDLAERGLGRLELVAVAELLGRRLADGDGPGRDAAHHHSLEDRLAADRGVARLGRRRGLAHGSTVSALRAPSVRFYGRRRDTAPAASCRPRWSPE